MENDQIVDRNNNGLIRYMVIGERDYIHLDQEDYIHEQQIDFVTT